MHGEHHDEHQSHPEGRQAEAQDRPGHDRAAEEGMRAESGDQPERNPERDREHHGDEGELQRRRQLLHDELDGGHVEDERLAQVAGGGAREEGEVLLEDRLVEAEGGGGARALDFVGLRIHQELDRVCRSRRRRGIPGTT
jgi:hypothetical protein